MWPILLQVALGGAFGAVGRYLMGVAIVRLIGTRLSLGNACRKCGWIVPDGRSGGAAGPI